MFKFMDTDLVQGACCGNNGIDPVIAVAEIGEGIEELNIELVKADILAKADKSLSKSIALDEAIAANGLANRGTVSYGIEALEMTATFLGVNNIDFDEMSAGIEDNDQEAPAEKKKGFLDKIKGAAIAAYNKIVKIIKDIIEKVKGFFGGKAIEKKSEELKEKAEKIVEKSEDEGKSAPKCDESKVEPEKLRIARLAPGYIYLHGLSKIDDVKEAMMMYVDEETVENVKGIADYAKKGLGTAATAYKGLINSMSNTVKLQKELLNLGKDVFENVTPKEYKQGKLKEELAKKFEKDILDNSNVDSKTEDFKILINGDGINNNNVMTISYTIIHKSKGAYGVYEKALSDIKGVSDANSAFNTLVNSISFTTGTLDTRVNEHELIKHIEPFSGKDIVDLADDFEKLGRKAGIVFNNIGQNTQEIMKETGRVINEVQNLDATINSQHGGGRQGTTITIGNTLSTFIRSIVIATSAKVRTASRSGTSNLIALATAVLELTNKCTGGEPTKL